MRNMILGTILPILLLSACASSKLVKGKEWDERIYRKPHLSVSIGEYGIEENYADAFLDFAKLKAGQRYYCVDSKEQFWVDLMHRNHYFDINMGFLDQGNATGPFFGTAFESKRLSTGAFLFYKGHTYVFN